MAHHLETGSIGEQAATDYLSSLGYHIIDRNFFAPFGEIDIITKDPRGLLVFVEVKTLLAPGTISPEDNLTRSKFRKFSRVSSFYANAHPLLLSPDLGFRLDLITVILNPLPFDPTIKKIGKKYFAISHYENILI